MNVSYCVPVFSIFLLLTACGQGQPQVPDPPVQRFDISDSLKLYVAYDERQIALINATIIDGTGGPIKRGQTIVMRDGYFELLGAEIDLNQLDGFTILDVSGKTIIPGIVGVHNHLHIPRFPDIGEVATKLYLAAGVTTIQTCGSAAPHREVALARRIAEGQQIGPDVATSGPYFTGPGGNPNMIIPRNAQHIRDTMQYWIQRGVSWFKVYRHTRPEDLQVIVEEAHRNNCKVTGHLCSITFEEAASMGIDGIEHGLNTASDFRSNKEGGVCNGGREYMDELEVSSPEVRRLQQLLIDRGVYLASTLSIYESGVPNRAFADKRTLAAMSPYLRDQYAERRKRYDNEKSDLTRERRLKRSMAFEYQFFKMGGLLGSGADAGRHNLPGYGDQRNFELLIEAGFSTEEAIQIMTGNGAAILERDSIGTIQIGKRADLVLLDGRLEEDPSVIKKVELVFKGGVGYDAPRIIEATNGRVGVE